MAVIGVLVEAEIGDEHDASPTSSRRSRKRELHDALGIPRAAPVRVLVLGHAEQDRPPGMPRSASSRTSLRSDSRVCCTTPGSEGIGCGSSMPSRTKSGAMRSSTRSWVSATSRRSAGVRRSRRGRRVGNVTLESYGRSTSTSTATIAGIVCSSGTAVTVTPRSAAASAVTGPMHTTTGGTPSTPAAETNEDTVEADVKRIASLFASRVERLGRRRERSRAIRLDDPHVPTLRGDPVGDDAARARGLRDDHDAVTTREGLDEALGDEARRDQRRLDAATLEHRRGHRADDCEAHARQVRAVGQGGEHALRSVRRGDHDPVDCAVDGVTEGSAAVGRIDDLDQRHLDGLCTEHDQPLDEVSRLLARPRDDDAPSGERPDGFHGAAFTRGRLRRSRASSPW